MGTPLSENKRKTYGTTTFSAPELNLLPNQPLTTAADGLTIFLALTTKYLLTSIFLRQLVYSFGILILQILCLTYKTSSLAKLLTDKHKFDHIKKDDNFKLFIAMYESCTNMEWSKRPTIKQIVDDLVKFKMAIYKNQVIKTNIGGVTVGKKNPYAAHFPSTKF